jgi:hypothetical protein
MADRIRSEPSGITRVRTVADQRWRQSAEAADNQRESHKRKPRGKRSDSTKRGGGIDEFA